MTDAQPLRSSLDKTVDEFYRQLGFVDSKANKAMALSYKRTVEALVPKFEKALVQYGTDPNLNALFKMQRLGSLVKQAEEAWRIHAGTTAVTLTQAQTVAVQLGNGLSSDLIKSSYELGPPGARAVLNTGYDYLPKSAIAELTGSLMDGSPVRSLTDKVAGGMAREMNRLLLTGLSTGVNPRETARLMRKSFDAEKARLETIVRTETLRAAREGSRKNMLNNRDVVKGWQWHSARDRRSCAVCFAMHGEIFELKTKMATHPNCRCTMLPVTKTWQELGFSSAVPNATNPAFAVSSADMLKANPELCRTALGRGGCLGFQADLIPLDRFVKDTYHPQWGYGRTTASLQSLVSPANARLLTRGTVPAGMRPLAPVARKSPLPAPSPLAAIPPPVAVPPPAVASVPATTPRASGTPVSDFIAMKDKATSKYGKDVAEALRAIDRVHGDGTLANPVPLVNNTSKSYLGMYEARGGKPFRINVSKTGGHRKMTTWHEVGHYIDNQAFGRNGSNFASNRNITPEWADYHAATEGSETIKAIRAAKGQSKITLPDGSIEYVSNADINYITSKPEIWARAYAQYIAEESGDTEQLEAMQRRYKPGSSGARVWPTADFAPIRAAITAILRAEGWK